MKPLIVVVGTLAVILGFLVTMVSGYQGYKYPFQDPSLPWPKRVDDLVGRLSLSQIANLTVGHWTKHEWSAGVATPGVPELGVKPVKLIQGCSRGITFWPATSFTATLGLAATFSDELLYNVSEAVSMEMRAFYNSDNKAGREGLSGLFCLTARTNVMRHPLWGRSVESFGEDPYLIGQMATAYIRGLQGNHPRYIRVPAGCNLYDAYAGPENYPKSRFTFDAKISERDLRMTFLPQYKACVDAGARHIMCSYNSVNGVPNCANTKLLTEVLRKGWGYTGHVISDAGAVSRIVTSHHYRNTTLEGVVAAIKAGCNVELLGTGFKGMVYDLQVDAVKKGLLTVSDVQDNIKPVILNRMLTGEFDPPQMVPFNTIDMSVVNSEAHQALAILTALRSFVLLKNVADVLPIQRHLKQIAVIGPFADDPALQYGTPYVSAVDHNLTLTPLQGLRPLADHVTYAQGCDQNTRCQVYNQTAVMEAMTGAEYVFVCLGTGEPTESEGRDRENLNLPGKQLQMLQDVVSSVKDAKIVLLLFNAGPLDVSYAKDSPAVAAIVECFFPAQAGGAALYRMLTMADKESSPAGRLPNTWPSSMAQVPPMTNYTMVGRTYRYFIGEPLYPFGYGLSYSQFDYTDLQVAPSMIQAGQNVTVAVQVINLGPYDADEVIQVYLAWNKALVPVPRWQLVGYRRRHLVINKPTTVNFTITAHQMAVWIDDAGFKVEPGVMTVYIGGQQPDQKTNVGSNVLRGTYTVMV